MKGGRPQPNEWAAENKTGRIPCEDRPVVMHGRGGGIRTRDPLHPMQVRYQAALHPEAQEYISEADQAPA